MNYIYNYIYKLAIYVSMMVNLPWAIDIYPPRIVAAKYVDGGFWEVIGINAVFSCIFQPATLPERTNFYPTLSRKAARNLMSPRRPSRLQVELYEQILQEELEAEMPLGWLEQLWKKDKHPNYLLV